MLKPLAVLFLVSLSACSMIDDQPNRMENIDQWHSKGRFTYISDEVKESGNFDWRQNGHDYQLRLYGPLGIGTVRISGNAHQVRIRNGDQDISSDQPYSLLYQMTGLKIPLHSLPDWLFGKPATPTATDQIRNKSGQLSGFSEAGWQLNFPEYEHFDFTEQPLPSELRAMRDDHQLRLLIRSVEPLK